MRSAIKLQSEMLRETWRLGVNNNILPNSITTAAKYAKLVQSIENLVFTVFNSNVFIEKINQRTD